MSYRDEGSAGAGRRKQLSDFFYAGSPAQRWLVRMIVAHVLTAAATVVILFAVSPWS